MVIVPERPACASTHLPKIFEVESCSWRWAFLPAATPSTYVTPLIDLESFHPFIVNSSRFFSYAQKFIGHGWHHAPLSQNLADPFPSSSHPVNNSQFPA
jgi:hypothetical protein